LRTSLTGEFPINVLRAWACAPKSIAGKEQQDLNLSIIGREEERLTGDSDGVVA